MFLNYFFIYPIYFIIRSFHTRTNKKIISELVYIFKFIFVETNLNTEDETQNWLMVYSEPWDTVLSKWRDSCFLRNAQFKTFGINIDGIIEAWPKYKHSHGAQLVNS